MERLNGLVFAAVLSMGLGLSATAANASECYSCDGATTASHSYDQNIVQVAAEAGQFNTLLAAAKSAGLVDALTAEGPITVFAPTDAAFAKLPAGTVESLLEPEHKDQLVAILTYHVVPGKAKAKHVVKADALDTVNGQRLAISVKDGAAYVDGAKIVATDIKASNGVIHVVDSVITPSTQDIVDTAIEAGQFNTLLAAAEAAGLVEPIRGDGPFTVFAPTDDAFAKLPAGTVENLLKPENKDQLAAILKYHVVPGRVFSDAVAKGATVETLQGQTVTTRSADGKVFVNGAQVITADIDASNGVIHVIDSVILPTHAHASTDH